MSNTINNSTTFDNLIPLEQLKDRLVPQARTPNSDKVATEMIIKGASIGASFGAIISMSFASSAQPFQLPPGYGSMPPPTPRK